VAVSATTRRARPGERDGREYYFLGAGDFERRVEAGDFLEHVTYAGNRYGTLRSEIDRIQSAGRSPVVEIELAGARAVRGTIPGAVSIFIMPPSLEELANRLEHRGTDSEGEIAARLETSRVEVEAMDEFDHRVVNGDLDEATEAFAGIVARVTGVTAARG
jgi:guanylate kinase